jgi:hypothetical protein
MSKITLFVFASILAAFLAPKPAEAQVWRAPVDWCQQDAVRCGKVLRYPADQIFVPPSVRGRNPVEQYQYNRELMRQRQQQDYNQGRYRTTPSRYGG